MEGLQRNVPFELTSLAQAYNYQAWLHRTIEAYLGQRILEVGAGIGNMSRGLPVREALALTEADPKLVTLLLDMAESKWGAANERVRVLNFDPCGSERPEITALDLDTIISFNVFEHIEDDHKAYANLAQILRKSRAPGPKRLITFVPAHNWAYGKMDQSFGHYRRYDRRMLKALHEESCPDAQLHTSYFNCFGLFGWYVNGVIRRQEWIGTKHIKLFEALCPWLSPMDDMLHKYFGLPFGQSILSVAEWNNSRV